MTTQEKVLALDLAALTPEELKWLHELKNRAQVLTGWLQVTHAKREAAEKGGARV